MKKNTKRAAKVVVNTVAKGFCPHCHREHADGRIRLCRSTDKCAARAEGAA